jgi:hypothetical protein
MKFISNLIHLTSRFEIKTKIVTKAPFILTAQKKAYKSIKTLTLLSLPLRDMNEIVNRQHSNLFAFQVAFCKSKRQK